jgi:hypothetical protein
MRPAAEMKPSTALTDRGQRHGQESIPEEDRQLFQKTFR